MYQLKINVFLITLIPKVNYIMQVFLRGIQASGLVILSINSHETVGQLREKIFETFQFRSQAYYLTKGCLLQDSEKKLADYGVMNESIIDLSVRSTFSGL